MNIFASDTDPKIAAQNLDNKRVVKLILESAQMLSTSLRYRGLHQNNLYRMTHINHPCSIWVRENNRNYSWLYWHFYYLAKEYELRFVKIHKSFQSLNNIFYEYVDHPYEEFQNNQVRDFHNSTNLDIEDNDIIKTYRKYLIDKWNNDKILPRWTIRGCPKWVRKEGSKFSLV